MSSVKTSKLSLDDLHFAEFTETPEVHKFDCGNAGLNTFLRTDEVTDYHTENYGKTVLVRHSQSWELVAFYTTSADSLKIEKARKMPRPRPQYSVKYWPALKIGRLAVDQHWQGKGLGTLLIAKIASDALKMPLGVKLLILNAEPGSIEFYERLGFVGREDHMNRGRDKPLLYMDLQAWAHDLGLSPGPTAEPLSKNLG